MRPVCCERVAAKGRESIFIRTYPSGCRYELGTTSRMDGRWFSDGANNKTVQSEKGKMKGI